MPKCLGEIGGAVITLGAVGEEGLFGGNKTGGNLFLIRETTVVFPRKSVKGG